MTMNQFKEKVLEPIFYSLPIRLLILHLRKNQLLLLCWVLLFSVVMGSFGKNLGIPYLFLDPEYLGKVDFLSFFIVGISMGGFTMAYHITCYILDGPDFGFLGTLSRPFAKFALNNGIIPCIFIVTYIIYIVNFQLQNEFNDPLDILIKVAGLLAGFVTMLILLIIYFRLTNKDIFRYVASNVDKRLKKARVSRVRVMLNLKKAKKSYRRVDSYFNLKCQLQKAPVVSYDKEIVLKVFDQNHLNSVIIEILIFVMILGLGIFRDKTVFQIPAAASGVLLLTIIIMVTGAITYWLRGWATTTIIAFFFMLNLVIKYDWASASYEAFGLNYQKAPAAYTLENLHELNRKDYYQQDKQATIEILENWRKRVLTQKGDSLHKPKLVLICTSGGGLRSALWTMVALQAADSVTQGGLMNHARLITGASGGLIGAAYFRELVLKEKLKLRPPAPVILAANSVETTPSVYSPLYLDNISQDNLNPVIFTLLVNDLFVRYQTFDYLGLNYTIDRGYAFEEQLNKNTGYVLDKKISDYIEPEREALIPMMLLTPAIVNDGRKLFISPQRVSYMAGYQDEGGEEHEKIKGIDFMRFFERHQAGDLRFLTALRMNAAFPYVTPNVTLPTNPKIQIMDAGLTDNFGVSDAVRFMHVFQDWINENTSGVIMLCIRDSQKNDPINEPSGTSLLQRMTAPFRFFYDNLFNTQDINNDDRLEFARSWLKVDLHPISIEYVSHQQKVGIKYTGAHQYKPIERPSLSWRLTGREKNSIIQNINQSENQQALQKLKQLLEE